MTYVGKKDNVHINNPITLRNIYFKFDRSTLLWDYKSCCQRLLSRTKLLTSNTHISNTNSRCIFHLSCYVNYVA